MQVRLIYSLTAKRPPPKEKVCQKQMRKKSPLARKRTGGGGKKVNQKIVGKQRKFRKKEGFKESGKGPTRKKVTWHNTSMLNKTEEKAG